MKIQTLLISALTVLSLTACSTTPSNPTAPVVLEQHKNISAKPETKHNLARLIKQKDNCVIEFTGHFEAGKATEHWIFNRQQLISAFSNVNSEAEGHQTVFDLNDPEKLENFNALKKNFKVSNLEKCI